MIDEPRELTTADVDWVVELAARCRERIVRFAPRFWNPAPGARDTHASFLTGLVESPTALSIRTDQGFVIGTPGRDRIVIDDMALEDESLWPTDGDVLLRRAAMSAPLRVVCPLPETARRTAVTRLGLSVAETWWHRDIDPEPTSDGQNEDNRLAVDGADAILVPAPPVYAPGGPVVLVRTVASVAALHAVEQAAGRRGGVVSVVSQQPDDHVTADMLESVGYKRTTEFFEGNVTQ